MKRLLGIVAIFAIPYIGGKMLEELDFFKKRRITLDKAYSKFLSQDVFGLIKSINDCDRATSIELFDGNFYICTSMTGSDGYDFMDVASMGDSIIKVNGDDFFTIKKKNGKDFVFNFIDRTQEDDYYKRYH